MSRKIALAKHIATVAHTGQKRKYDNRPYIVHPEEVVGLMVGAGVTDEDVLAAGWLHDVVEDTTYNRDAIYGTFGGRIGKLVLEVTDVSEPWMGTREQRKSLDRLHLSYASPEGKTIKLADMISNTRDIIKHDEKFAKVYMEEKSLLLPWLREGNFTLYMQAEAILEDYYSRQ